MDIDNQVLHAKAKSFTRQLESGEHAADPSLSVFRDMTLRAESCTNGSSGDIGALSGLVASIAIVLTERRLGEKNRAKEQFEDLHGTVCPFEKDHNGKIINPPWTEEIKAAMEELRLYMTGLVEANAKKPAAKANSFYFGIPKWKIGFGAEGDTAKPIGIMVVGGCILLACIVMFGYIMKGSFAAAVDARLATISQAVDASAQESREDRNALADEAVRRTEAVKEAIREIPNK